MGSKGWAAVATALSWLTGSGAIAQALEPATFEVNGDLTEQDPRLPNDQTAYDRYQFQGKAGEVVAIEMVSTELDPFLILRQGTQDLVGNDDAGANKNALIVMPLPADGSYEVLANGVQGQDRGRYTLRWRMATPIDQARAKAWSLLEAGREQFQQGNPTATMALWEQALTEYRQLQDATKQLVVLNNLAALAKDLGDRARAIDYWKQSLTFARARGDAYGEGSILVQLGRLLIEIGQQPEGEAYLQSAVNQLRSFNQPSLIAPSLAGICQSQSTQGKYTQALSNCEEALTIARSLNDQQGQAILLSLLTFIYQKIGQAEWAVSAGQESLDLARRLNASAIEAITLSHLALAQRQLERLDEALATAEQGLAVAQNLPDGPERARVISYGLSSLGAILNSLQRPEAAITAYEQALSMARASEDRGLEGSLLNNLASAYYQQQKVDRAKQLSTTALKLQEQNGDWVGAASSLNNLGYIDLALQDPRMAVTFFRRSLELLERMQANLGQDDSQRIALFETQQKTYTGLQRALIAQGQIDRALAAADRGRARSLLDLLRSQTNQPVASAETAELRREQMQAIARRQNATVVLYSVLKTDLYIWVVPPQGEIRLAHVDLQTRNVELDRAVIEARSSATIDTSWLTGNAANRSGLNRLTTELRSNLTDDEPSRSTDATSSDPSPSLQDGLRQAHDLLIAPITPWLPSNPDARLIIVPHRELGLIPFGALVDNNGRSLIDRYTLAITPSLSVLDQAANQRDRLPPDGDKLIVGNPAPMPNALRTLPGAEIEARDLGQQLQVTPLLGQQANETAVKARLPQASLLHFATHGIMQPSDRPEESPWLALAADQSNDGKLTADEVASQALQAQLAVLSACDTGRGKVTGEGTIGLARAFLRAGVPTVVATLWKVPDRPTALLMGEFYRQLAAGRDRATALRNAQQTVRAEFPSPRNWAAFVIMGDTR